MQRVLAWATALLVALGAGCAGPAPAAPASAPVAGEEGPPASAPGTIGAEPQVSGPHAPGEEALPSTPGSSPAGEEQESSAPGSAPAAGEDGQAVPASEVAGQIRARLAGMSPPEAAGIRDGWNIPGWAVYCVGTAEVPEEAVLACQWGQGYNALYDGRVLFWREGGEWRSQPYPPDGVVGVGSFHGLRREGNLVQVVMNVGGGQTRYVAQVGLLAYEGGEWRAVWGPEPPESNALSAVVVQPPHGIDRYTRFLGTDGVSLREEWERDGARYVMRSRIELTPDESFVSSFAQVLLSDPEAARWSSATAGALEQALQMELPERLREGFTARSVGAGEVLLEAAGGAGAWRVTVVEADGRRMVTAIRPN